MSTLGNLKFYIFDFIFLFFISYLILDNYYLYDEGDIVISNCIRDKSASNEFNDNYLDFEGFNNNLGTEDLIVPNIFHYINLKNGEIGYDQYVSILSVVYFQNPYWIFIHHGEDITLKGKYWNLLKKDDKIKYILRTNKLNYKQSIFEKKVKYIEHVEDILKLEILMHYGGVFLNRSAKLYNSVDHFRKFEMTIFKSVSDSVNLTSTVFIANRNARFLKAIYDNYRLDYRPSEKNWNSEILPGEIFKNHTFLAHEAKIINFELDKKNDLLAEKHNLVLLNTNDEFFNQVKQTCTMDF